MVEGNKGEKKWDNCNSIINKIYLKNNITSRTLYQRFFSPSLLILYLVFPSYSIPKVTGITLESEGDGFQDSQGCLVP